MLSLQLSICSRHSLFHSVSNIPDFKIKHRPPPSPPIPCWSVYVCIFKWNVEWGKNNQISIVSWFMKLLKNWVYKMPRKECQSPLFFKRIQIHKRTMDKMLEFWPFGEAWPGCLAPPEPPLEFAIIAFAQTVPGNREIHTRSNWLRWNWYSLYSIIDKMTFAQTVNRSNSQSLKCAVAENGSLKCMYVLLIFGDTM